ncbi:MAG: hypothetical protein V3R60_06790 [Acidobacteriota bacterium]
MSATRIVTFLIVLGSLGMPTDSLAQAADPIATGMWTGVKKVPPGGKVNRQRAL